MRKYHQFLSPFADLYCWCLLPNHFHFLIRLKRERDVYQYLEQKPAYECTLSERRYLDGNLLHGELVEFSFKNFFQSYALSFNNTHERKGNLFYRPFKRILVDEKHFTQAFVYIHANPVKHGLCKNFEQYKWSSWHALISNKPCSLLRNDVWDWFGNRESMISQQQQLTEFYYESDIAIEK